MHAEQTSACHQPSDAMSHAFTGENANAPAGVAALSTPIAVPRDRTNHCEGMSVRPRSRPPGTTSFLPSPAIRVDLGLQLRPLARLASGYGFVTIPAANQTRLAALRMSSTG